ncbi:MAG: thiamine phosphate synthase, partial [Muribaculaceae bacterium]|nr:thiamine phosphate synthase [Muribaculaceae bacterium]
IRPMCRKVGATFLLDDHVELVKELGADGVHVGKNDMPPSEAKRMLGPGFIVGATANTFDDIAVAAAAGADYIGLGPFRFTTTKERLSPVIGTDGYRRIMARCREAGIRLPVVAIGGITPADIPGIMSTGVVGIALSGAILNVENPIKETHKICQLLS